MVWLSNYVVQHISEVAVCLAELVLRWVIISGPASEMTYTVSGGALNSAQPTQPLLALRPFWYLTGQLSLAIPLWVGIMSTHYSHRQ